MKGSKILLTGATGFIGSHVAKLLLRNGCTVYAVIRRGSNTWRLHDIISSLRLVSCDLMEFSALDAHLEMIRPDLCIHLAWDAMPSKALSGLENVSSLSASLRLASRLANLGCRKLVVAGTCFEYDTDIGYLSETSWTRPRNLYAASKLALYFILEQFERIASMEITWLRFFYLYGPFEDQRRLVPSVILSLLNNHEAKVTTGEQIRDYLHVEDAAAAVWAVIESELKGVVNIGSGRPVTVREIVTNIGTLLNRSEMVAIGALQYRPGDPMFVCANNRRLLEKTTWVPRFELHQGLHQTIEWWQRRVGGIIDDTRVY